MENVKALLSEKFKPQLLKWSAELDNFGYVSFCKVMNALDYGVPQSRPRVFMVSILGGGDYHFPEPFPLEKRMKDVLEDNPSDKYMCSEHYSNKLKEKARKNKGFSPIFVDAESTKAMCVTTRVYRNIGTYCKVPIANLSGKTADWSIHQQQRIIYPSGVSPTITALRKKGQIPASYKETDNFDDFRLRLLTPRECFRLMDVDDADIDKMLSCGVSDTQLYKLAGNSIVVSCLYHIFRKMFVDVTGGEGSQLSLFLADLSDFCPKDKETII